MKKCAELVDERALTKQKIEEQVQLTRQQFRQVRFFRSDQLICPCPSIETLEYSRVIGGVLE